MKATVLIRRRVVLADDAFVEIVVWRLHQQVSSSSHEYKYRLAYVVQGKCVLRYDNERGKGDHRHFGTEESSYVFTTPDQLMSDFDADVMRWDREHGRA